MIKGEVREAHFAFLHSARLKIGSKVRDQKHDDPNSASVGPLFGSYAEGRRN
jgi:hypothetical protein